MKTRLRLDGLESRLAPATAFIHYGVGIVGGEQQLAYFASDDPATTIDTIDVLGLAGNQDLLAIDVNPADGLLYGLAVNGSTGRMYTIDPNTGEAVQVGNNFSVDGGEFGLDFDPATGLAHLVGDTDEHLLFDPVAGTTTELPALDAASSMVAAAFSADALFGFDTFDNEVVRIDPVTSALTSVGLLGFDATAGVGFDVAANGDALLSVETGGASQLHAIDLTDGSPTLLGDLDPLIDVIDIALLGTVTVIDDRTAVYTDADGDTATVKVTKGAFSSASLGMRPVVGGGLFLGRLELGDAAFAGTTVKVAAQPGPEGGDGFVNVGTIDADGLNLGTVTVDGDLGRIVAGDADNAATQPGVKSVSAQSMGRFADVLGGFVHGALPKLAVKGDVRGGGLTVTGRVNTAKIGGSLFGGSFAGAGSLVFQEFKTITIGGDVIGGGGFNSGSIIGQGKRITILGSVRGQFTESATISGADRITIGGDVVGGGAESAVIVGKKVTIGGDLRGGAGSVSARVVLGSAGGTVTLGGSVVGGTGLDSGVVDIRGGTRNRVTIGGSIVGGAPDAGVVRLDDGVPLASLRISGIIVGGVGVRSGLVRTGADSDIGLLTVGGDIRGGLAEDTGGIIAGGDIDKLLVGGGFFGDDAVGSGIISVAGDVGTFTLGGSVIGWTAADTSVVDVAGDLGTLVIGDSIEDIGGANAGIVRVGGTLGTATIKYDIVGFGFGSSQLVSGGDLGSVTLGGSVIGGPGLSSGTITSGGRIASLTVGRDLRSGTGPLSGAVSAATSIDALLVKGSLVGTAANRVHVFVGATASDVPAIGKLTVNGRVEFARILAGYSTAGGLTNTDASIGSVTVGSDWIASDLVAAASSVNSQFGDDDDLVTSDAARIEAVVIKGQALGTVGGIDHFGFVAREVGSLSVGGTIIPLTDGTEVVSIGITDDLKIREIA